jgi:hypothetical protein
MNHSYAFALLMAIPLVFAAARYFKDLDDAIPAWLIRSLSAGLAGGFVVFVLGPWITPPLSGLVLGSVIGAAVFFVSRRSREHDVFDGILTGGIVAVGFGIPLLPAARAPLALLVTLFLSGIVSGAVAATLIGRSAQGLATQMLTMLVSVTTVVAGSRLPEVLEPLTIVSLLALMAALVASGSVIWRSGAVASELSEEAKLGLLDSVLAARIAHPTRRMSPVRMSAEANRKIVRLAWALALEKRRQRSLDDRHARLRQLEILNLRKQLAETLGVIREIEFFSEADDHAGGSDTIAIKG